MEIKKFKDYSNLSKDTEIIDATDNKIKGEIQIEEIIDIFLDPNDINFGNVDEGVIGVGPDLTNREVKRGDTVYLSCLIKKKGQSFSSPATQAVLRLRIIDIYHGLQYLNKVIN